MSATMTRTKASSIPGYLRPPPVRRFGLTRIQWTGVLAVAALGVVELVARSEVVSPLALVPVEKMVVQAVALLGDGEFLTRHLLRSVATILTSFALAAVGGVLIALVMHGSSRVRRAVVPYLSIYYAIPVFALYPMAAVIFGLGVAPIIVTSTAFAVVVVIMKALEGFESVAPAARKLAKSVELSRLQYARMVLVPSALPDIATGLKIAFGYSIVSVLAMEFILSTQGLGWFISHAYDGFETANMYAAILIVAVFALGSNLMIAAVLRRFDWRRFS